jgi:1-deoxy-D-xylulose-5-phosphate synthase
VPTAIRFPKAKVGDAVPAVRRVDGADVLHEARREDVLVVSVGALARAALDAAARLDGLGIGCTVVDPRWVLPVSPALARLAQRHRLVVTVEEGVRDAGVGSRVASVLAEHGVEVPVCCLGLPSQYLPHGTREDILVEHGLDGRGIADAVTEAWHRAGRHAEPLTLVTDGGVRGGSSAAEVWGVAR